MGKIDLTAYGYLLMQFLRENSLSIVKRTPSPTKLPLPSDHETQALLLSEIAKRLSESYLDNDFCVMELRNLFEQFDKKD